MQVVKSMQEGANHLGGGPDTPDVDPDREFWPAGQGVGAIDELVPAGELVLRFVREAEDALGTVQRAFV
jgi:enoyl-[acyl-carrier protein] reductase II